MPSVQHLASIGDVSPGVWMLPISNNGPNITVFVLSGLQACTALLLLATMIIFYFTNNEGNTF